MGIFLIFWDVLACSNWKSVAHATRSLLLNFQRKKTSVQQIRHHRTCSGKRLDLLEEVFVIPENSRFAPWLSATDNNTHILTWCNYLCHYLFYNLTCALFNIFLSDWDYMALWTFQNLSGCLAMVEISRVCRGGERHACAQRWEGIDAAAIKIVQMQ